MKSIFPSEWRTQIRWKRRFYARYMRTLERAGYVLVAGVFAAFVAAFNIRVEDVVSADKVAILPFTQPLSADGPTLVARVLAADRDAVRKGQPLFEIVAGAEAILRYQAWQAVQALPPSPERTSLLGRTAKPPTAMVLAPADGTFRLDTHPAAALDDKASLGRVVDYDDLRVEASLGGDTVSRARPDGVARVVNIAVDPVAGTLFRGGGAISGSLLGESAKALLVKELVGRGVRLRDDIPLEIADVKEVQVDAAVAPSAGNGVGPAVELDPPANLQVAAQVVEGKPAATVQVADLPHDLLIKTRQAVLDPLNGRTLKAADGTVTTLGPLKEAHLVVKLKAGPGEGSGTPIPGTMLSRTFDAKLRLVSPPASLIEAVRAADAAGRGVTCRVELRTGERPVALRLLKKS